jgi:hypothetical protein
MTQVHLMMEVEQKMKEGIPIFRHHKMNDEIKRLEMILYHIISLVFLTILPRKGRDCF